MEDNNTSNDVGRRIQWDLCPRVCRPTACQEVFPARCQPKDTNKYSAITITGLSWHESHKKKTTRDKHNSHLPLPSHTERFVSSFSGFKISYSEIAADGTKITDVSGTSFVVFKALKITLKSNRKVPVLIFFTREIISWQFDNDSRRQISQSEFSHCPTKAPVERRETTGEVGKHPHHLSLHIHTNATRVCRLLWLLLKSYHEKEWFTSHGCRTLKGRLWTLDGVFCRVSVRKRLCALYVCMRAQMAPHLRGACVLVSCNSRGWMEDRLSGSQGRVDRLLKTVERDTTASAHAYSQNRHTILVGVIATDRQPSECLLLVALALLQSSQAFHLTPASCAVRNGKGNHC